MALLAVSVTVRSPSGEAVLPEPLHDRGVLRHQAPFTIEHQSQPLHAHPQEARKSEGNHVRQHPVP